MPARLEPQVGTLGVLGPVCWSCWSGGVAEGDTDAHSPGDLAAWVRRAGAGSGPLGLALRGDIWAGPGTLKRGKVASTHGGRLEWPLLH